MDMVNAAPEIAAAEYFGDRMILGRHDCSRGLRLEKADNQKIAFDRFSELRNVKMFVIADRAGNHYETVKPTFTMNRRGGRTMTNPWLSVVMPCRNGERWLAEALQSVVEQHEPGIEVVFIDGSDSEASMKIVESFAGRLALSIHRRPDLGSGIAKTGFGVQEARADWITMLHVDDLWLPGRGAALRRWLAARSNAVMHLHPAYFIDGQGKRLGIWRCPLPAGEAAVPGELLLERLLVQNFIAVPATAIRRDAFLHVGGMDESLWHTADWDLYLKLAAVGTVHYHPEPLACFRIHGNSLTMTGSRDLEDYRNQTETVFERHIDKLKTGKEPRVRRLSAASININTALAAANVGRPDALAKALRSLLRLGPCGIQEYLYYSRIIERALSRLRVRLAGGM
jgi:glycosyltransferase involved in cell wall biosynthesis